MEKDEATFDKNEADFEESDDGSVKSSISEGKSVTVEADSPADFYGLIP